MTSAIQCPGENEILEFLGGTLSPERSKACQEHIEVCASCCFVAADAAGEAIPTGTPPDRSNVCTFRPNELIGGRYRIVRFLAHGGMGEVYEAEDHDLGERIALKIIAASISDDPLAAARLRREVQVARLVTHPNVCRIFDLGRHRQLPETTFLTMELLTGETLGQRIRRLGRLDVKDAEAIARQVAAGLDAAHAAGVVHRDLKSDNIMLLERGPNQPPKAVVMDFGLARPAATAANASGSLLGAATVGTVGYMAPEQVVGGLVTTASDIYAFGVVLFELFTGLLPFVGTSPLATAAKRLTEPPRSPRALRPELDSLWESTILRCLERDPAARFATAGEAVRCAGPAPLGPRLQEGTQAIAGTNRSRVRLALVAGAATVLALGLTAYAGRRRDQPTPTAPSPTAVAGAPVQASLPPRPLPGPPPGPSLAGEKPTPAEAPIVPADSPAAPLPSASPHRRLHRLASQSAAAARVAKDQVPVASPATATPRAGRVTDAPREGSLEDSLEDSLIDPFADR